MEVGIRATRLLGTQTEGGNRGARLPERGVLPGKALPPGLDPDFLSHHRHLKSHCLCRDRCSIPSGQTAYAPQLYLMYGLTKPPPPLCGSGGTGVGPGPSSRVGTARLCGLDPGAGLTLETSRARGKSDA